MDSPKIAELKRAHQEFFKTNKNQKIKSRINYLKKLKRVIDGNENLILLISMVQNLSLNY